MLGTATQEKDLLSTTHSYIKRSLSAFNSGLKNQIKHYALLAVEQRVKEEKKLHIAQ